MGGGGAGASDGDWEGVEQESWAATADGDWASGRAGAVAERRRRREELRLEDWFEKLGFVPRYLGPSFTKKGLFLVSSLPRSNFLFFSVPADETSTKLSKQPQIQKRTKQEAKL